MRNKIIFLAAILFAVFLVFGNEAKAAATLYVDVVGVHGACSDSRSYDQAQNQTTPFCSIQKAADIVNPGDTVIVKDGTYTDTNGDDMVVKINRSGGASNWITFQAENKWGAVIDGQSNTTGFGFEIYPSQSYIIIDGFEVKDCTYIGIQMDPDVSDHIKVLNNKIHDIAHYCSSDPAVTYNPNGHGLTTSYSHDITIDSNKIYNIGVPSDCRYVGTSQHYGMYLNGHNMTVTNNILYDNYAGWDIHIGRSCADADDGKNFLISNNTFYGYDPKHSGNIIFFIRSGCSGQFSNVKIQNNISYDPKNGFFVRTMGGIVSGISMMNNLVYGPSHGDNLRTSAVGYVPDAESGNITGQDPLFTDLPGRNFYLQATSPVIDEGLADSAPSYDIEGTLRPQKTDKYPEARYDIGAYEYVSSQPDTTPPDAPTGLTVQ